MLNTSTENNSKRKISFPSDKEPFTLRKNMNTKQSYRATLLYDAVRGNVDQTCQLRRDCRQLLIDVFKELKIESISTRFTEEDADLEREYLSGNTRALVAYLSSVSVLAEFMTSFSKDHSSQRMLVHYITFDPDNDRLTVVGYDIADRKVEVDGMQVINTEELLKFAKKWTEPAV